MSRLLLSIVALLIIVSNVVLAQGAPSAHRAKAAPTMPLVEGKVVSVDAAQNLLVLDHGDIPNLAMGPMTMGFAVADKAFFKGLKPGDRVRFQAEMRNGEATVTELKRKR